MVQFFWSSLNYHLTEKHDSNAVEPDMMVDENYRAGNLPCNVPTQVPRRRVCYAPATASLKHVWLCVQGTRKRAKQDAPSRFANGLDEWQCSRCLFKVAFGRAQPQRNMCWLHRLLDHGR
jgi:hypothetical protein